MSNQQNDIIAEDEMERQEEAEEIMEENTTLEEKLEALDNLTNRKEWQEPLDKLTVKFGNLSINL